MQWIQARYIYSLASHVCSSSFLVSYSCAAGDSAGVVCRLLEHVVSAVSASGPYIIIILNLYLIFSSEVFILALD